MNMKFPSMLRTVEATLMNHLQSISPNIWFSVQDLNSLLKAKPHGIRSYIRCVDHQVPKPFVQHRVVSSEPSCLGTTQHDRLWRNVASCGAVLMAYCSTFSSSKFRSPSSSIIWQLPSTMLRSSYDALPPFHARGAFATHQTMNTSTDAKTLTHPMIWGWDAVE